MTPKHRLLKDLLEIQSSKISSVKELIGRDVVAQQNCGGKSIVAEKVYTEREKVLAERAAYIAATGCTRSVCDDHIGEAERRYPLPRTLRVSTDDQGRKWRFAAGAFEWNDGDGWRRTNDLWTDLLKKPTEGGEGE